MSKHHHHPACSTCAPFVFNIFGGFGNLSRKSLYPAIYALAEADRLPDSYVIMGYGRSERSDKEYRDMIKQAIKKAVPKAKASIIKKILSHAYYCHGAYDSFTGYENMDNRILELCGGKAYTRMVYFAIPPLVFKEVVTNLGSTSNHPEKIRLIFEKPFGESLEDAKKLYNTITRFFAEDQVFLLDHYLGKTSVQSVLFLRQANRLLSHLISGEDVDNIQISALEEEGIADRAGYFEKMGTLKDMMQSHLLQLFALTLMDIPTCKSASSIHREKISVLESLQFDHSKASVILGQYASYKKEQGVAKDSTTETFVALRTFVDREEWYNIPIYLRSGKKLKKKSTTIVIELKKYPYQAESDQPNRIIFELAPEPKLHLQFINRSGTFNETQSMSMESSTSIACTGDDCLPEHAKLLMQVMEGNRLYFLSIREIFAGWKMIEHIEETITKEKITPEIYKDGSLGPTCMNDLTDCDHTTWFNLS